MEYKGHTVEVTNGIAGKTLRVDGEMQDEQRGFGIRSCRHGRIKTGDGQGEAIKVSLGGRCRINCAISIDDHQGFRS